MRRVGAGPLLALVGVTAALLYLGGSIDGPVRLALKAVPVLGLAAWVSLRSRQPLGRLTAAGLVLAAVGDVLLDAGLFLPGLGAFLLAHVLYTLAFLAAESRPALALGAWPSPAGLLSAAWTAAAALTRP